MSDRNTLAEKMEVVGRIFEIDGMPELLKKFEAKEENGQKVPLSVVKFNAVVIQVSARLLQADKSLADKVISMSTGKKDAEVQKMDDGDYAAALRTAIITDVLGFFASSPRSDGKA